MYHMELETNPHVSEHRRVVHGGLFSAPRPGFEVLDFSSNINPLGPPPASLVPGSDALEVYPDPDSTELRMNLQQHTGVSHQNIVAGNGATEIIYNFCRAFVTEGMPVLIPAPTFGEYEAACRLSGASIIRHRTMDVSRDIDDLISHIPVRGCVFVCNPNNPTGGITTQDTMQALVKQARRRQTMVFVDECFIELVPDSDESLLPAKRYDNLFVLRSMTKSFALAGARIGYGVGSQQMIAVLSEIKIPWNVSGPAQRAASAALADLSYLTRSRDLIRSESKFLVERISKIRGFKCRSPSANFILVKTEGSSDAVRQKLLRRGVLVRDCSSFYGLDGDHIRVAVRTRAENIRLVEAMSSL